jgi:transcriptional repressor NF-X1
MTEVESGQNGQQSGSANRGGSHTSRRGRPGRGRASDRGGGHSHRGNRGPRPSTTATATATATATVTETVPAGNSQPGEFGSFRGGRGRRGLRHGRRGGPAAARGGIVPGTQRRFGGHLTSQADDETESVAESVSSLSLNADALEFVPGQPVPPKRYADQRS